jgi:flavocytochrome c
MNNWDTQIDVLVVGSGFAGLTAALEAAQAGCSVQVIEKRDFYGGNSWISGGVLAAVDLEMQQRHGIQDSTAQMFDDMMRAGRARNDPALVQQVCAQSYSVLQWLRQDLGITFMDRIEQFGGHSVPRCYSVTDIQGRNIVNPLLDRARALNIDLRLNTSLTRILQNEEQRVIGCELTSSDNTVQRVQTTHALILASGGFSGEADELKQATSSTRLTDSTDEILNLAQQLGAELIDLDCVQLLPCASPDEAGRGVAPVFASYVVFPYGMMLDASTGQRFVNEWTDRKTRADAMLALQQPAIGLTDQNGINNAGDMIHQHMNDTVIRRFEALEILANAYQLPVEALKHSVHTYNQYIEQKHDAAFGKPIPARAQPLAPPYYALRLWPKTHSTMGGLRINAHTQVLNTEGQVISGLFAAGEVTGGVHGVSRLGGCAITECLVLGRVAGQQAALFPKF